MPKTASNSHTSPANTHQPFSFHRQQVQQLPSLGGSLISCGRKLLPYTPGILLSIVFDFQQISGKLISP